MVDLAKCGTFTAYKRHKRNGEPVDDECARAARDQKNSRKDAERRDAAEKAQAATGIVPDVGGQLEVLHEIQRQLRAQMLEAPPQSVAAIARELRNTTSEIASLSGESQPQAESPGAVFDELAQLRSKRA